MDTVLTRDEQDLLDQVLEEVHGESNEESHDPDKITIPENPAIDKIDETASRFSSAEWFNKIQKLYVTVAGLGGIGSWTALLLARTKVGRITLYDDDIIETGNLSGQFYRTGQQGISKVLSISHNIREFADYYNIYANAIKFTALSCVTPVMIGGFDNMKARRDFFTAWHNKIRESFREKSDYLFIDGRLAAEEFQVFCFTGEDTYLINKYANEWLFDDSEAEETLCSYKQTTFCANLLAGIITNLVVNFAANKCNPLIKRELPFMTRYNASLMKLTTL